MVPAEARTALETAQLLKRLRELELKVLSTQTDAAEHKMEKLHAVASAQLLQPSSTAGGPAASEDLEHHTLIKNLAAAKNSVNSAHAILSLARVCQWSSPCTRSNAQMRSSHIFHGCPTSRRPSSGVHSIISSVHLPPVLRNK